MFTQKTLGKGGKRTRFRITPSMGNGNLWCKNFLLLVGMSYLEFFFVINGNWLVIFWFFFIVTNTHFPYFMWNHKTTMKNHGNQQKNIKLPWKLPDKAMQWSELRPIENYDVQQGAHILKCEGLVIILKLWKGHQLVCAPTYQSPQDWKWHFSQNCICQRRCHPCSISVNLTFF